MQIFQNRNFIRRVMYSWPVVVLVFSAAVFVGQSALRSYLGAKHARSAYFEVKKEREDLAAQRADLEKRLNYLSTPYGLEKELRRKFGLVKPGEELMIIVDRPQENERPVDGDNLSAFFSGVAGLFG